MLNNDNVHKLRKNKRSQSDNIVKTISTTSYYAHVHSFKKVVLTRHPTCNKKNYNMCYML